MRTSDLHLFFEKGRAKSPLSIGMHHEGVATVKICLTFILKWVPQKCPLIVAYVLRINPERPWDEGVQQPQSI